MEALKPVQQQTIDLSIAAIGILSTLACFVPNDSWLGRILQSVIKELTSLGKKFKK